MCWQLWKSRANSLFCWIPKRCCNWDARPCKSVKSEFSSRGCLGQRNLNLQLFQNLSGLHTASFECVRSAYRWIDASAWAAALVGHRNLSKVPYNEPHQKTSTPCLDHRPYENLRLLNQTPSILSCAKNRARSDLQLQPPGLARSAKTLYDLVLICLALAAQKQGRQKHRSLLVERSEIRFVKGLQEGP